jgi:hypothetical protein
MPSRYHQLRSLALLSIQPQPPEYRESPGRVWGSTWYEDLKRLVLRTASESDTQRAEELLDMVSWSIVDTGPAGGEFCPSINLAQDMLVKIRLERDRAGP